MFTFSFSLSLSKPNLELEKEDLFICPLPLPIDWFTIKLEIELKMYTWYKNRWTEWMSCRICKVAHMKSPRIMIVSCFWMNYHHNIRRTSKLNDVRVTRETFNLRSIYAPSIAMGWHLTYYTPLVSIFFLNVWKILACFFDYVYLYSIFAMICLLCWSPAPVVPG